jgi:beta-1,4-N-acetylglucosaminyltransferase
VAPPFFLVARLLGIRTVFIEVYDRVDSPTVTGRLCYPLSDLFILQWEEQRRFYPKGRVIGVLL